MNRTSASAWLCGLATGLAAGLLFAPKAGRALRQDLKDSACDMSNRLRDQAQDTVDETRTRLQGAVSAGREAYQAVTASRA
jgi:gas vesicle protein